MHYDEDGRKKIELKPGFYMEKKQALNYMQRHYDEARKVIYRILQIGLAAGVGLAFILFLGFGPLSYLFSTDSEVLKIARSGTLFVAVSQPMNAIAFVLDGLYYGLSDFAYATYSMVVIGLVTSAFFLLAVPKFGLAGVWTGLFLFMTLRVLAGIWRAEENHNFQDHTLYLLADYSGSSGSGSVILDDCNFHESVHLDSFDVDRIVKP